MADSRPAGLVKPAGLIMIVKVDKHAANPEQLKRHHDLVVDGVIAGPSKLVTCIIPLVAHGLELARYLD